MPYRVDLRNVGHDALERLVELGALDVDLSPDGGIAALIPDGVAPEQVATALGVNDVSVSVLSGIPSSAERDVDQAYRRQGMRRVRVTSRGGWVALVLQASW